MAVIKMHEIVSSNIKAVGYDRDSKTLQITFSNGATYTYSDVPLAMYEGIFTADSAGKYVQQFIVKGKYKSSKNK